MIMLLRFALGIVLSIFTLLLLVVAFVCYAWWRIVGLVTALLGRRLRMVVSRYLGCYPFMFVLVATAWMGSRFLWAMGRADPDAGAVFRELCMRMKERIDAETDYRNIGGFGG